MAIVTIQAEKCDSLNVVILMECFMNNILSKVLASSKVLILRNKTKTTTLIKYHGGSCRFEVNGTENRCLGYE